MFFCRKAHPRHVHAGALVQDDQIERVVKKHKKDLKRARKQVALFLSKNGFPEISPNSKKQGRFGIFTFPLHEAVKQNNPYITSQLLLFGANPRAKDTWFCTAYHYAKAPASHQKVREVFESLGLSPKSPRFLGTSKLERSPPPAGWESFFAKVATDPLASWRFEIFH